MEGFGKGYTTEQVASFPLPAMDDLLVYFDIVRAWTLEYLRSVGIEELGTSPVE